MADKLTPERRSENMSRMPVEGNEARNRRAPTGAFAWLQIPSAPKGFAWKTGLGFSREEEGYLCPRLLLAPAL